MKRLSYAIAVTCTLTASAASAQTLELETLRAQALGGSTSAQVTLAQRYQNGDGLAPNFAKAVEWFRKAADSGEASAQNQLGRHYHAGLGVAQDVQQALAWLKAAADQGQAPHVYDYAKVLGELAETPMGPEAVEAARLYRQAADAGHIGAISSLGFLYQEGKGVAQDFDKARTLYETAAQAGDAKAMNNLGLLYVRANGVPQDYLHAFELFQAAGKLGLRRAYYNMGIMYENGFGVAVDETRAAELFRLAGAGQQQDQRSAFVYDPRLAEPFGDLETLGASARAGDPVAQFQYAWILVTQGTPSASDWGDAAELFHSAAQKGLPVAMINLGRLYELGRGVPQDYVKAQMWYGVAAAMGRADILSDMAALQNVMTADQINTAQKMADDYLSEQY